MTGFGLLGHLHNAVLAPAASPRWSTPSGCPAIDGVLDLLDGAAGDGRCRAEAGATASTPRAFTSFAAGVSPARERLVCDATTSGGLLVAVARESAARVPGAVIGRVVAGEPGTILVQ